MAVQSNDSGRIHQVASQQGNLRGQFLSMRAAARAKFLATLTPDQRTRGAVTAERQRMSEAAHQAVIQGLGKFVLAQLDGTLGSLERRGKADGGSLRDLAFNSKRPEDGCESGAVGMLKEQRLELAAGG